VVLSQLIIDKLKPAADPLSNRSSRLKAACGQDCPPHNGRENLKGIGD
jgi:hypothetical protein